MIDFDKLPKFKNRPRYKVDIDWKGIERNLKHFEDEYQLQINPDFQRGHVWTEEQRIKYIEFKVKGGFASDMILFNCPEFGGETSKNGYAEMVLVDGLQRLTSIRMFLNNELKIFDKYFHKDIKDFPRHEMNIIFAVNNLKTKKEVLEWYIELNTGGTVHTEEEINKVKKMI